MAGQPLGLVVPGQVEATMIPALASLPESLWASTDPHGAIHVVDGRSRLWPGAVGVAEDRGAVGVLVLDPAAETGPLDDRGTIPVVIAQPWASNPIVDEVGPWRSEFARADLITVVAVLRPADPGELRDAAADAARLIARLTGRTPTLEVSVEHPTAISLAGTVRDAVVRVGIVMSDVGATGSRIRLHSAELEHILEIPQGESAAASSASRIAPEGQFTLPSVYESYVRASLRRLVRAVLYNEVPGDLIEFASVASVAGRGES